MNKSPGCGRGVYNVVKLAPFRIYPRGNPFVMFPELLYYYRCCRCSCSCCSSLCVKLHDYYNTYVCSSSSSSSSTNPPATAVFHHIRRKIERVKCGLQAFPTRRRIIIIPQRRHATKLDICHKNSIEKKKKPSTTTRTRTV